MLIGEEEGRTSINYNDIFIIGAEGTPPEPRFTLSARIGAAPLTINFDGSFSSDDGSITSYDWHFDDYSVGQIDMFASGATASNTYSNPGHYYPRLAVTDDAGNVIFRREKIIILDSINPSNQSPVASFTTSINELEVDFDASASSDSDGCRINLKLDAAIKL